MAARVLVKAGKRWLYFIHRWLGIAACLFFLFWFVSGVVMMYVPYPSLKQEERLAGLAPIDWSRVMVDPTRAMAMAGLDAFPRDLRLDMAAGEPAWRMRSEDGARVAISAVDGRRLAAPDSASAEAVARRFAGGAPVRAVKRIHDDQWTVAQGFRWARPLWKVSLDDAAGTELYVASTTGEVAQATTAFERGWNWIGAVPHWLYLTAIRRDGQSWRQIVMWTSGPAVIVGITGLWIGILRVRLRRRYRSGSISPYASGWMKWHHITGLIGGLFAITWMTSGWLSVNPFDLFVRNGPLGQQVAYAGHATADFPPFDPTGLAARLAGAREAKLYWVGGRPVVALSADARTTAVADSQGATLRFGRPELIAAASHLMPGTPIRKAVLLTEPDIYWYSHGDERPLPALRVIFADVRQTWATIDPATGALLGQQDASGRTYRWLFNALHDFDLPFLLANRGVRDPLMWLLSGFGIVMSLSGIVIGWRHLRRKSRRVRKRAITPATGVANSG